ncbi:type II CAAX prenyl endopeptidase Rce1 family protein [Flavobacterium davisii]|uniref:CPBP family glutamic-type intramembrane protease n=1 Tax=Flavobacterium davisii TaxID=2906077 RepID=UPI0035D03331
MIPLLKQLIKNIFLFSVLAILLNFIIGYSLNFFFETTISKQNDFKMDISNLLLYLFLAPLLETFFFQFLIIYQVFESVKNKYKTFVSVFLSALFFGLIHIYSTHYFIATIILGVYFSVAYLYFLHRANHFFASIQVFFIHAFLNTFIFIVKFYFS